VEYIQSGGSVSLSLPDSTVGNIISNSTGLASIDLSKAANATIALLPKDAVTKFANAALAVEIKLPQGSVTLSPEAAKSAAAQAAGANVSVEVKTVPLTSLNPRQQAAVGSAPVYDISLMSNSQYITSFGGGLITIALPYTLKPGEKPAGMVVWYLDADGNVQKMETTYDVRTGEVIFTTDHLSKYFVTYDPKTAEAAEAWVNPFADVQESDWFYGDIAYAHKNGLMAGTDGNAFSPNTNLTRAMLITILARADATSSMMRQHAAIPGDRADATPSMMRQHAAIPGDRAGANTVGGDTWYSAAVEWGITSGITDGQNMTNDITREQMVTILYRYAKLTGRDVSGPAAVLTSFTDAGTVSYWAIDAVSWANATSLLSGRSATELAPLGTATRAEAAAILRRFIENGAKSGTGQL
jgi:hypothetical protein